MKNSETNICELMESKMNKIILEINQTHDSIEADKLHSELRVLDWIFYEVCKDQQKKLAINL
jgi:ATP-dependent protease HslVU (ClpYQ) ATPase subunit